MPQLCRFCVDDVPSEEQSKLSEFNFKHGVIPNAAPEHIGPLLEVFGPRVAKPPSTQKGKTIQQLIKEKGFTSLGWNPTNGKKSPFAMVPESVVNAGMKAFEEAYNKGDYEFCGSCYMEECNVVVSAPHLHGLAKCPCPDTAASMVFAGQWWHRCWRFRPIHKAGRGGGIPEESARGHERDQHEVHRYQHWWWWA
eukprot:SAG31_NODE_6676_length_1929_cov_2.510929_2_plen_195_part_00